LNSRRGWLVRPLANRSLIVLAAALCLFTSGCMKSLREHSTALAAATAPVIDQARAAYQAANAIHEKRANYDEIRVFEQDHSIDKLKVVHELIDDKDIELRLKVLTAFQLYVKTLVEITNGTESPELDAASKSLGKDLAGLGNTVAPTIENALGIPATGPTTTYNDGSEPDHHWSQRSWTISDVSGDREGFAVAHSEAGPAGYFPVQGDDQRSR
jgi:hypothetical protein